MPRNVLFGRAGRGRMLEGYTKYRRKINNTKLLSLSKIIYPINK
jgi:hypothetical protein